MFPVNSTSKQIYIPPLEGAYVILDGTYDRTIYLSRIQLDLNDEATSNNGYGAIACESYPPEGPFGSFWYVLLDNRASGVFTPIKSQETFTKFVCPAGYDLIGVNLYEEHSAYYTVTYSTSSVPYNFQQDAGNLSFTGALILTFVFLGFVGYVFNHVFKRKW